MKSVNVFDIVGQNVLVSRESARSVKASLAVGVEATDSPLRLDFTGARGVSPSFLDEALVAAVEFLEESDQPDTTVIFARPPTVLAAKHHAIARAHGRTLVVNEAGDWEFRKI